MNDAEHIDRDHPFGLIRICFRQPRERGSNAGIVDGDIERTEMFKRRRDHGRRRCFTGDVAHGNHRLGAMPAEFICQCFQQCAIPVAKQQPRTLIGKVGGYLPSEPPCGARDQYRFPGEPAC